MTTYASWVMQRASILLQDTANTRWPLIELVTWLNDGMREIVLQNPTALSESLVLPLVAGTYQTVPPAYAQVLRVVRNLKTNADSPRIGGRVVRVIDRLTLDAVAPDWHDSNCTPQTSIVANVIFDEDDPFAFYVYPGNDGTGIVEVIASAIPAEVWPLALSLGTVTPGAGGTTGSFTLSDATPPVGGTAWEISFSIAAGALTGASLVNAGRGYSAPISITNAMLLTVAGIGSLTGASIVLNATQSTAIASYDVPIDIHDMYKGALVDYVMYRAYSKDSSFAGSLARAAAHYQQFQGAIGVRAKDETRNPNTKVPVNPGSAA